MRTQIFKQYQGPWASKPFPGGGTTVKGAGCGLCSVTHILIEDDGYKDYTPEDIRPYMIKWAVRNAGLIHEGIPDTLKHYGMENVKEFGTGATMKQIFAELDKGSRIGVILFYKCNSRGNTIDSIGPDGTCWTGGGHFIGFTDYKVENGKHWFYMKDSGSRNHDGWFSYENSMKGCVWKVWTCTIPGKSSGKKGSEDTKAHADEVIDISYVQSSIDWAKVKADGITGAMIRCGYRGYGSGKLQEDECFSKHVKGAVKAGLKIGVYFFTEAINAKEGKEEAAFTLNLIKREGIKLSYPVAVDTEAINAAGVRANDLSRATRTTAVKAFCDEIKSQGYEPMIYASTSWLDNKLDMSKLPYKVWVAQYNDKVTYKGSYVMWQYTSTGRISGISGVVDLNKCYLQDGTATQTVVPTKNEEVIKMLTVDGVAGTETIKAAQMIFGTPVDGVISGQAEADMKHCPGIAEACLKEGKGGSQLVRALQRKVGAKEDGYLGTKTIKAVQKWLGIDQDGSWGTATSKAFQTWLNKQIEVKNKKSETKKSERKEKETKPAAKLSVPTAAEIKEASVWAVRHDICEWHKQAVGKYYYKHFTDDPDTHKCPLCHPGTGDGGNCIWESWAGWHHGGKIPCRCSCEVINNQTGDRLVKMSHADALATIKAKANIQDLDVIVNKNGIPTSKLLPADIILYYDGGTYEHSATWMGNGRIADCSSANPGPNGGVVADKKHITYWDIKVAIRYTGGRSYLSIGANGTAVRKIQAIVGATVDGNFGTGTQAALKKWQKAHGLTADGFCGPATLKKMAEVIK